MNLEKGMYVTRNSYNNDTIFKILNIDKDIAYLKGENIRLYADSPLADLIEYNQNNNDNFELEVINSTDLDRSEYFYLPAKILHIDAVYFDN